MRLRVRSSETKETFRLDVPSSSTLSVLKAIVAARLPSSTSTAAADVLLSLNRQDELAASSPDDTLASLGLASGDLLFYSLRPSGFLPEVAPSRPLSCADALISAAPDTDPSNEGLAVCSSTEEEMMCRDERPEEEGIATSAVAEDAMEAEGTSVRRSHTDSVTGFLKRVLVAEKEKASAKGDLSTLVISVHAVFLESGFVACNFQGRRASDEWTSKSSTVSMSYTIPELLGPNFDAVVGTVYLKFLPIGRFVDVCGFLNGSADVYRLCLDASKFVSALASPMDAISEEAESSVVDFWKRTKDSLSLPLQIDLCERNGLPLPPCFTSLPTDLKMKILEFVSGVDLAKVGCVNSELRYLSSNCDLWEQKFLEEFSCFKLFRGISDRGMGWKGKFVTCWENRKIRRRFSPYATFYPFLAWPTLRRQPVPFGAPLPGIIGGDHDLSPAIGLPDHSQSRRVWTPFQHGRCIPHCSLDGFDV